ncbi:MAG: hypothetical protein JW797_20700 [Bradymonadales bacterium]|nr:hypothetical protein [Bradymonadales bacterium]
MAKRSTKPPGAVRTLWRTRPFLAGRLAEYSVFLFASIGFISTLSFLFFLVKTIWLQVVLLLVTAAGFWLVFRSVKRRMGHVGHHPHIAAMVTVFKGGKLAKRQAQVEEGMALVSARFPKTSEEFYLENLVGKVVKETTPAVIQREQFNPFPGFNRLKRVSNWILSNSLQVVRSVLFGYTLYQTDVAVWHSTRQGLNLYAQMGNKYARSLVRTYMWGVLFGLVCIAILLVPGIKLFSLAKSQSFMTPVILFLGIIASGWVIKRALFEPFALARALSVFFRQSADLTPSAEWDSKLYEASNRFRDIIDRTGTPVARVEMPEPGAESQEAPQPGSDKAGDVDKSQERVEKPSRSRENGEDAVLAPTVRMPALSDAEEIPEQEVGKFADDLAELDSLWETPPAEEGASELEGGVDSVIVDQHDDSGEKPGSR